MNAWMKRGLCITAFSAGTIFLGTAMASADEPAPDGSLVSVPVAVSDVDVDVLDNSITVSVEDTTALAPTAGDDDALVSVPVTARDVDIDVLSDGGGDSA